MTLALCRRVTRQRALRGAAVLALGGFLATVSGTASDALAAQKIYQWGSASLGSTGYVIITTLSATVNKFTKLRNSSLSTAGGAENMALIGEGVLDFGQSTSSDWPPALSGTGRYTKPVKAYQMFSYTIWNVSPIVRADSDIKTIKDLVGKRMMPGPAGGATAGMYKTLFEAAGLYDKMKWTYGSWRESYNAMKSGAVDSIPTILTSGNASPVLLELETARKVRVLDVPDDVIAKAQKMNPGIMTGMVSPKTWKTLGKPTKFISFTGILAAHPRVDEETAYQITKAIYDNAKFVQGKGIQLKDVRLDFATKYLIPAYPVHPGAARYLKEKGVWRDDLKIGK